MTTAICSAEKTDSAITDAASGRHADSRQQPPKSATPNNATGAPKTTGSINPPKGQKQATNTPSADPVGDICLLPDIAGFAH